jgi:hypothetical protein
MLFRNVPYGMFLYHIYENLFFLSPGHKARGLSRKILMKLGFASFYVGMGALFHPPAP